jgi:RNA polymerase sigma-70 factor, ECF subfamily
MSQGEASSAASQAAERAARGAYGRLLAWLAWQWRDIAAAEDALADALLTALTTWPRDGVPASPEGWLMTAAKRNLLKAARHRRLTEDPAATALLTGADELAPTASDLPDDRLRLMFVCAHPAIDPAVRTALMLQTVLGLDAARIASGCLVAPEAMTKRLVRAKAKIKANCIRFEEPEARELPARVSSVLEAIYGAYTLDWNHDRELLAEGGRSATESLAAEAHYLAKLVASLLPQSAEAWGLLGLIELGESRRHARVDDQGLLVPLHEQDCNAWDAELINSARSHVAHAATLHCLGPFQLEAAIQMAHASRKDTGDTPWFDIQQVYEGLLALHPSVGAVIGYALATAYAHGKPTLGLEALQAVNESKRANHQPWWAAQAHLLERAGRPDEAVGAYAQALALTRSQTMRRTLTARQTALGGPLH